MLAILRCDPHSSVRIFHYDVITKEPYDFGMVLEATFCFRGVQLEYIFQEGFNLLVDFLRFLFGADGREHKVIGIPAVSQTSEFFVVLIGARYCPHMSLHLLLLHEQDVAFFLVRFPLYFLVQPLLYDVAIPDILRVIRSFLSSFEVSYELCHKAIEFMEVDVCQYWGKNSPLWRTAVGAVVLPIFHVSRFGHLSDDVQELLVINLFL